MFERNKGEKKRRCDRALPPNERKLRAKQLSPPVVRIISHCFPVNTLAAKRADNRGFREFFRDPAHAPPLRRLETRRKRAESSYSQFVSIGFLVLLKPLLSPPRERSASVGARLRSLLAFLAASLFRVIRNGTNVAGYRCVLDRWRRIFLFSFVRSLRIDWIVKV